MGISPVTGVVKSIKEREVLHTHTHTHRERERERERERINLFTPIICW